LGSSLAEANSGVEKSTYQRNPMAAIGGEDLKWGGSTFGDLDIGLPDASLGDGSFIGKSGRVLRPSVQVVQGETFFNADGNTFTSAGVPDRKKNYNELFEGIDGSSTVRTGAVPIKGAMFTSRYPLYDVPAGYVTKDGQVPRAAFTMYGERALAYRIDDSDVFIQAPKGYEIKDLASYQLDELFRNTKVGAANTLSSLGNLGLNLLDSARSSFYQGSIYAPRIGTPDQFQAWGEPLPQMTFTDLLAGAYSVNPAGIGVNMGTGRYDLAGQGIGAGALNLPFALAPFGLTTKMEFRAADSVLNETSAWRNTGANTEVAGSRMAELNAKWGDLSSSERRALLDSKSEATWSNWLSERDAQAKALNPKTHFMEKHGPDTTLLDQEIRATQGIAPDGSIDKAFRDSTRFLSARDMGAAMQRADSIFQLNGGINKAYSFQMESFIGEGFTKAPNSNWMFTTNVNAVYRNGQPYTMFPLLRTIK